MTEAHFYFLDFSFIHMNSFGRIRTAFARGRQAGQADRLTGRATHKIFVCIYPSNLCLFSCVENFDQGLLDMTANMKQF